MLNVVWMAPVVACVVAFISLKLILKAKLANEVMDQPNDRSLHTLPVPRVGGLGIIIGLLTGWGVLHNSFLWSLAGCVVVLVIVSLMDDLWGLSAFPRFLAHCVVASVFLGWLGWPQGLAAIFSVLAVVWMINLYNFMDGSDGLAGGMAVFGFGFYALAAMTAENVELAAAAAVVAASTVAFLWFNFHPARVFMGDAGSIPLGFLAAAMGLLGMLHGDWPVWFPLMVFSPFIVDASLTLLKRILKREAIWQAHRSHYYQRLVRCGWGHRKTALAEYALMLSVGVTALWLKAQASMFIVVGLLLWVAVYIVIAIVIDEQWRRFVNEEGGLRQEC